MPAMLSFVESTCLLLVELRCGIRHRTQQSMLLQDLQRGLLFFGLGENRGDRWCVRMQAVTGEFITEVEGVTEGSI